MKHRNNRVRRPIGGNVISAIKFRREMARRYARSAQAWAGRTTGLWRQRPMAYYGRIDPSRPASLRDDEALSVGSRGVALSGRAELWRRPIGNHPEVHDFTVEGTDQTRIF